MESRVVINVSDHKEPLTIKKEETSRKLLWVDIGHFPELWQFLICSFVVFIFFIPYGYLQVGFFIKIIVFIIFTGLCNFFRKQYLL